MIREENSFIGAEVLKRLIILPIDLQEQVLDFVVKLNYSDLHGIPSDRLIQYAGTISSEDLDIMANVIKNECGKVDISEW